jgi:DNA-entry nuclease
VDRKNKRFGSDKWQDLRCYDLLSRGVEMEAYSVEDKGRDVCFHVFVYNVQPGIGIDYHTGENWAA